MSVPQVRDWSDTRVYTDQCVGITRRVLYKVDEMLKAELKKLEENGITVSKKKHYKSYKSLGSFRESFTFTLQLCI